MPIVWGRVDATGRMWTLRRKRAEAALARLVAARKTGEKLALVLDIDETSLTNYCEMKREDYGFISMPFE